MNSKDNVLHSEAIRLSSISGNVRGEILRSNIDYIQNQEGKKAIPLIEEKLKELGYPLRLKNFNSLRWYPEFISVLIILILKEVFSWSEQDIFNMGNSVPKSSFIVKFLMKYFTSLKKCFKEASNYWRIHFDFGELEPFNFSEKEKYLIIRVKDYNFHPLVCFYHAGYFLKIAQFNIKSKKIDIQETKCLHKDDVLFHEYKISWL